MDQIRSTVYLTDPRHPQIARRSSFPDCCRKTLGSPAGALALASLPIVPGKGTREPELGAAQADDAAQQTDRGAGAACQSRSVSSQGRARIGTPTHSTR